MLCRVLTGKQGVEAVQAYMTLGASGARFDASRVRDAIRRGRARLIFIRTLGGSVRSLAVRSTRRPRVSLPSRPGGSQSLRAAPARPRSAGEGC